MFFRNEFDRLWDEIDATDRVAATTTAVVKSLAGRIAELEKTVTELRDAHNELYKYDVSKRFRVTGLYSGISARLAKTTPQSEPIPVQPAKAPRKR